MIKIFQIASELNVGSVGRIAEQIGEAIITRGWESHIAYARDHNPSRSISYKIGNKLDHYFHAFYTRLTDRHAFASKKATKELIATIREINPDIIHLHHMHGYFMNIEVLFKFLADFKRPVVWTFHDCWSFTGHCAYYEFVDCQKWQTQCHACPQINDYPKSFIDNSTANFQNKNKLFNSVADLTIVPVSYWLGEETKKSFLKHNNINVIQNGIDLEAFIMRTTSYLTDKHNIAGKFVILGVASPWIDRKGLKYFVELSGILDSDFQIILIGLDKKQIENLPSSIIGLEKTGNVDQLAEYYSLADVFVNTTLEDTFPTTNLESQACGTPVITFRSGGAPEAVSAQTGIVVDKGNMPQLLEAIYEVKCNGKQFYSAACRERAEEFFNKKNNFEKYIKLYQEILNFKND